MEDGRRGVHIVAVINLDQVVVQKLEVERVPHHLRPMEEQLVAGQPRNPPVVQQIPVPVRNSEFCCIDKKHKK